MNHPGLSIWLANRSVLILRGDSPPLLLRFKSVYFPVLGRRGRIAGGRHGLFLVLPDLESTLVGGGATLWEKG